VNRLLFKLERLVRFFLGTAFAVLICAVLIQVVGRVLGDSPVWTEELTRFALLFLAAFGAGLSFKTGDLVNVDLVCESLPWRWPWILRLIAAVLTAGLCFMLLPGAWKFSSIGVMQTSPALGWRMDFIHASILVMLVLLALFSTLRVLTMVFDAATGKPQNQFESKP